MRVNIRIDWKTAPSAARFGVRNAAVANGLICLGWGKYDSHTNQFTFTSAPEPCRMCFAVDVTKGASAFAFLDKTENPFEFNINTVLQSPEGILSLKEIGVTVMAETDYWADL